MKKTKEQRSEVTSQMYIASVIGHIQIHTTWLQNPTTVGGREGCIDACVFVCVRVRMLV